MSFRRLLVLSLVAGLIGVESVYLIAPSMAQTLPSAAGPQQMFPYGAPETYPSTYPSTSTPAAPGLPQYNSAPPTLMAQVPNGSIRTPGPALSGDPADVFPPPGSTDPAALARPLDPNTYIERSLTNDEPWTWQILPTGLLYRTDLASGTEPRLASQWVNIRGQGWFWDPIAGGRAGLLRYGSDDALWPQGWQLDVGGAAFPRLDANRNMVSTDFRVYVPLTMRQGPWEFKFGYTHLSSHLGDLYMIENPGFTRINYVRDSLTAGVAMYLNPSWRLYAEAGWAFRADGGAQPWEYQFGADFSPPEPTTIWGAPFFAINGHLRQENDFGGNLTVQTGIQWRGRTGNLFRVGAQYFNGMSEQGQFYRQFEEQIGGGIWYDF